MFTKLSLVSTFTFYYLYRPHKGAFKTKFEIAIVTAVDEALVILTTTIALRAIKVEVAEDQRSPKGKWVWMIEALHLSRKLCT